ncbi:hypothetical protein GT204_06550 [Streptomyces sp. SID4919]|uniref:hypothetical protein n=1 Tax=unclassified Streptomyces TaxID=2593676 RepID=UPI00082390C2|nr:MULTISPECIES: hypothetical protein [unclassified Streptomyces]MYY08576.1 hypothetical protein [Streptomyces sp. SID4919]SCK55132.1 hypothetical protein YW7DRAFT_05079 [Streptomyces sp. AmelKG-E11A]
MSGVPPRGAVRHSALALILIGFAWHLWRGSPAGLVLAATVLAAHGVAAALGYWWLRRRLR